MQSCDCSFDIREQDGGYGKNIEGQPNNPRLLILPKEILLHHVMKSTIHTLSKKVPNIYDEVVCLQIHKYSKRHPQQPYLSYPYSFYIHDTIN